MMAFLRWILSLVIAAAAVLFALGNRDDVAFVWSPLHESVQLPVFAPVLAALLAGFVAGGFFVWVNGAPVRAERRRLRKQITKMEEELREAEARAAALPGAYAKPESTALAPMMRE